MGRQSSVANYTGGAMLKRAYNCIELFLAFHKHRHLSYELKYWPISMSSKKRARSVEYPNPNNKEITLSSPSSGFRCIADVIAWYTIICVVLVVGMYRHSIQCPNYFVFCYWCVCRRPKMCRMGIAILQYNVILNWLSVDQRHYYSWQ